jgi:VWFA-related protein
MKFMYYATFALIGSCLGPVAFSQQSAIPAKSTPTRIRLDVVVAAKTGPPVSDLQVTDFTLLDNKASQPIEAFKMIGGKSAPVEVTLVIDAVNNSYQEIAYEREQIAKFLKADDGKLAYPTTLAVVSDKGTQIQEAASTDGNATNQSLEHLTIGLRSNRPSSGIYGADERLQLSIKALSQLTEHEAARPGRKIILWISPGWPLLSGFGIEVSKTQQQRIFATVVDLSRRLREASITLYAVDALGVDENPGRALFYQQFVKGASDSSETALGDLSLQVLAVQSGGLALNSSDVLASLQKCMSDTDVYYELSFEPARSERPNEYHHLDVNVDKPGLTARTRDGYYAQP